MSELREYLQQCLGGTEGRLHIATGHGPHLSETGKYQHAQFTQSHFAWPGEADLVEREIMRAATDSDIYVCPYLMWSDKRVKGAAVARRQVHADVDHGQLDTEKVHSIDGFAVASGTPGNGHVYVALTESVPAHWHRALCRGLGDYLGGADAKISENDVLRPPGTLNHKPTAGGGDPAVVTWLVPPNGVRVDPRTLAHQLGITLPDEIAQTNGHAGYAVEQVNLDQYPTVGAALDNKCVPADRSADTMRVVAACKDAGLTLPQTRWVISTRPDLAARLAERDDDDVQTCWLKVIDTRQTRQWAEPPTQRADSPERPPDDVAETIAVRPVYPAPAAPLDVARKLYSEYRIGGNGLRTMRAWRGGWMIWRTTDWSELDTAELRSDVYDELGGVDYMRPITEKGVVVDYERTPWNPDKRKVANVLEAMEAIGHLSTTVDPPAWIGPHSAAETTAGQIIPCTNGLLDLSTRKIHDHTPALFNVVSVPFDFEPDAPKPAMWHEFLASVWPDDPDSIALLQEYIGYVLSGRTDMQKLLLLIGPTRSGKGTIARMLGELIGHGHVAGPTLASLGTNFGLSPLLGKPLAVISDARLGDTPAHTVVERLLSITGEDLLTVDRKFRDPWSGKLPTRFVVLSNELPRFKDASGAIANRLLILQMTKSFLGREDRTLDRRLRGELPGILAWALDGLDRLTRNSRFTVPGSSEDAANLMMDMASPVSAFIRDQCVRKPGANVLADDLYSFWKTWCEDNGHHAGAKSTFGRNLRAVVPEVLLTQPRINGVQLRRYERIGLASDHLNGEPPVSPASDGETPGQNTHTDTGSGTPIPCHPQPPDQLPLTDTGSPVSPGGANPQVNDTDAGDTGTTPFKPEHETPLCRFCGGELRLPSQRIRGFCGRAPCVTSARQQTPEGGR